MCGNNNVLKKLPQFMMLREPLTSICTLHISVITYLLGYMLSQLKNMDVYINVY